MEKYSATVRIDYIAIRISPDLSGSDSLFFLIDSYIIYFILHRQGGLINRPTVNSANGEIQ